MNGRSSVESFPDARAIATSIARTDFLRRPSWEIGGTGGHREWLHFSIGGPDLTLLVNLSIVDDLRPSASRGRERGRVVVLVRADGRWDGGADEVPAADLEIHGGSIFAVLGDSRVEFEDGVFRLAGRLRDRPVAFDLVLRPLSFPSMASNVPIGRQEEPINWVVVPTLRADGWLTIAGERREIHAAPAYHDHNWGYFTHRDFAWQWGHAFPNDPASPFSFVFTRLLNGTQTAAYMQALLLWRGGRQHRVLREGEIRVVQEGFLRKEPFAVPRSGKLLAGGAATDIPKRLRFDAQGNGDTLTGCFEAVDVAQIVLPNEHDLGTTLIHEVVGDFVLHGSVRGEAVDFEGHAVFECLGRGP